MLSGRLEIKSQLVLVLLVNRRLRLRNRPVPQLVVGRRERDKTGIFAVPGKGNELRNGFSVAESAV